jgi:hypothetical protein
MRVICVDDSNKPIKVPVEQWIKKGETYTITRLIHLALTPGKMGVLLKEVQLGASCFPYEFYDAERFAPENLVVSILETVQEEANLEELV